ncbi:ArnT family glycosyltransferase [Roseimarinus sediminis]|uniref:ArnT family glycosyltransferase n=1 Tax=Roseimarinus sediminis TaxID=1610899 RepID=UPI003D24DFD6
MINKVYRLQLVFVIVLLFVAFVYNYHEILFYPPFGIHIWRQSDSLSITQNFFRENLSFFAPQINWTGPNGNHKTVSEFPLIYYSVAQLWKIIGQKEFIFRLINIGIVFSGLIFLFRILKQELKDNYWAMFVPLFLFASPLLTFYTNNFTADAPALGLILCAAYFYYSYRKSNKLRHISAAVILASLAGMIKITSLILFVAVFSLLLLELLISIIKKKRIINDQILSVVPFLIVIVLNLIWYTYAKRYNAMNLNGIFLQDIYPIWDLSAEKRKLVADLLYFKLLPTFYNKMALAVLGLLSFIAMAFNQGKHKRFLFTYIITLLGVFIYIILWFKAFDVHDYYLTNLLIIVPLALSVILLTLKERFPFAYKHLITKLIATACLLLLIWQTSMINRIKYDPNDRWLTANYFMDTKEVELWKYKHHHYQNYISAYESITPYLRELGISRNDLVYSTPDATINHTLYLMDQKGFSDFGYSTFSAKENINKRIDLFIEMNAKYLIVNDPKILSRIESRFLEKKIGQYKNIEIYQLF